MKRKNIVKRIPAMLLAITLCGSLFFDNSIESNAETTKNTAAVTAGASITEERLASNYTIVSSGYKAKAYKGADIVTRIDGAVSGPFKALLTSDNFGYSNKDRRRRLTVKENVYQNSEES